MSKLMETLFSLLSFPESPEAEQQAVKASRDAVQAVERKLTYEEFENFWNAVTDIREAGHLDSFTLGFRLGVQLTLEGLRPIE